MNFVDLAGSEKHQHLQCNDKDSEKRKIESSEIKKSLLALERVIISLNDQNFAHAPYRESKLTRILKDSLGSDSELVIIATISMSIEKFSETIQTLNFATNCRGIVARKKIHPENNRTSIFEKFISPEERKKCERPKEESDYNQFGGTKPKDILPKFLGRMNAHGHENREIYASYSHSEFHSFCAVSAQMPLNSNTNITPRRYNRRVSNILKGFAHANNWRIPSKTETKELSDETELTARQVKQYFYNHNHSCKKFKLN